MTDDAVGPETAAGGIGEGETMRLPPIWPACMLLVALAPAAVADTGAVSGADRLDGKSFHGSIRAKGVLGLFSRDGTLAFEDGLVAWTVDADDDPDEYPPAAYSVSELNGSIVFEARMTAEDGGTVDWSGVYADQQLSDVQAVWIRAGGDFIHDLLLPDVVTMVFTPD